MPKIKPPVRTPHIDMTPMVDLFSVLLIFLLLTATFRPSEATVINSPGSVSEKTAQDKDIMTIVIDKDGKVFFNIDNGKDSTKHVRENVLTEMGKRYNINFSKKEISAFSHLSSFGMPMADMKKWLSTNDSKVREKLQTGIPMDSTDNQLSYWVRYARIANPYAEVAIKGDGDAEYTVVKKVMDLLQDNKVNKFNLVTNLMKQNVGIKDIPPQTK
ncbi:MAG: biopolymer transporter ExbD [Bacteroidota bacterium]|nr:biopolymer transporter ExbD [Bacteroidota bacterium]